jgi:hypothetical protein
MPAGRYRLNGVVPPDVWAMMSPAEQAETLANYRLRVFPATAPPSPNPIPALAGIVVGVLALIVFLAVIATH